MIHPAGGIYTVLYKSDSTVFIELVLSAPIQGMPKLIGRLQVSVAEHVHVFLIFCLFCSQLTVLFTHFSARCKILFWVDTPWKSLCRSISTWYTGHNLNMGEQLYTILCLLLCAISYFLLYLLTVHRPEYSLYISSYVMLWPEWKIKRFVLYCCIVTILYHLHQCRLCTSRDISCLSW